MRYIAGALSYGLYYTQVEDCKLRGFTDSNWAGSVEDRRSTSGNMFSIGSATITWSPNWQEITALSTTEAEYISATSSACQVVWLRKLLSDIGQEQKGATDIYYDNKSAIALTKNPIQHWRTKHIDIRFHFIRNLVSDGSKAVKFCHTEDQVANIFTKVLSGKKHSYFRMKLGVCNFELRACVERIQS